MLPITRRLAAGCLGRSTRLKCHTSATSTRSVTTMIESTHRQHQHHQQSKPSGVNWLWGSVAVLATVAINNVLSETVQAAPTADSSKDSTPSATPSSAALEACHNELRALLGERFSRDGSDLASHGQDAFSYHKSDAQQPSGVAFVLTTEEVSQVVKICAKHKVIMIPYGSGTSLEGHTTAPYGGICIDLSRMQTIKSVNVGDMDCVVEAGISWGNLNLELKKYNLFFPVDPGPGASIGGMVGTSCSGTNAVRYGTMKQSVLNLTVVMPDGSIVKTANRARKSSSGYDLTRLFIGSEGTLGIVTEITLSLQNIPESTAVATASFNSITDAAKATSALMQRGVRVGCVELLDDGCIQAVNSYSGLNYPLRPATLFFKFHGAPGAVREEISIASAISQAHGSGAFTFATDAAEREKLWEARKGALWACIAFREGCEAWTTDVCVPISRMAECIEQTKKDLLELDLDEQGRFHSVPSTLAPASSSSTSLIPSSSTSPTRRRVSFPSAVVGHVGDGNFHVVMMLDPTSKQELALAGEINRRMIHRAIAMEGTCTGEHGVGVGKKDYMELEHGREAMELMKQLKRAVDPDNLMNPGKIFDQDPGTSKGGCSSAKACCLAVDGGCAIPKKKSPPTLCC